MKWNDWLEYWPAAALMRDVSSLGKAANGRRANVLSGAAAAAENETGNHRLNAAGRRGNQRPAAI